jgi:hypothetical protein
MNTLISRLKVITIVPLVIHEEWRNLGYDFHSKVV